MRIQFKISRLLWLCLVITPLILIPNSVDYFYLPKIYFVYMMLAVIFIVAVVDKTEQKWFFKRSDWLLVLYILVLVLATLNSENLQLSIWGIPRREEGIVALIAYVMLFYFAKYYLTYDIRWSKWVITSAAIVALYAIFQFFGFDPIPRDYIRLNWSGRPFSTMGNPNFLGSYLVLMMPLSLYQYFRSERKVYLGFTGILYWALICTFTRSSWLAMLVSVIGFFFVYFKENKMDQNRVRKTILTILLLLSVTVSMDVYSNGQVFSRFMSISRDVGKLATSNSNDELGSHRIYIWKRVMPLVLEKPLLGHGPETLGEVFTAHYQEDIIEYFGRPIYVDKVHNEYLHMAFSSGILSLFIYLILVGHSLKKAHYALKKNLYILPIYMSVIGYLIQAFFNISVVSVAYVYWIFLGFLSSDFGANQGEKIDG